MTDRRRILVVDDEPQIQRFLKPALTAGGYIVAQAVNGRDALRQIDEFRPDVIVLDLGLPDMDGKTIILHARQVSELPIIVLSARDQESEKIAALDLGANDYVAKPFGIGELMARLRAALRQKGARGEAVAKLEAGDLVIDIEAHSVTRNGHAVRLTPKEFDLLRELATHPGKVITHRTLLGKVWGAEYGEMDHYVRVFVNQLRKKLKEDPARNIRYILNEPGIGYRFIDLESEAS